jgi:hypothetical protein
LPQKKTGSFRLFLLRDFKIGLATHEIISQCHGDGKKTKLPKAQGIPSACSYLPADDHHQTMKAAGQVFPSRQACGFSAAR